MSLFNRNARPPAPSSPGRSSRPASAGSASGSRPVSRLPGTAAAAAPAQRKRRAWQVALSATVLVLASGATIGGGWGAGFQYWLMALVPSALAVASAQGRDQWVGAMILAAWFVVLDHLCRVAAPWQPLNELVLQGLRMVNIIGAFAALTWQALAAARLQAAAEAQADALATTDTLTGLNNRRRMLELVDYELAQRRRRPVPLSVLLIDVDQLKRVNDRHGTAVGDEVLQAVSRVLGESFREQDSVARWGGEEFLVLLPGTDAKGAAQVAERLCAAVAAIKVKVEHAVVPVSVSVGLAEHRGESADPWIARAGAALLRGKQAGAGRVEVAPLM
jgi:diguanylate cyclase (GGDEF)-like protein